MNQEETIYRQAARKRQYQVVVRNERLTALAAAVLLVGFIVDLFVTTNLHKLIMTHIFIGVLLAGPLTVKLFSVGYRFFRYYGRSPAFVAKGAPNMWMRLLAPFLIMDTLALFLSGIALALHGPINDRLLFLIHAATAALWVPMIAVHVYAHIRLVPRSIARDWAVPSAQAVSGRVQRLRLTLVSLVVGAVAAVVITPMASQWRHAFIPNVVPSPLILGLVTAVIGVIIAVPILRGARD